MASGDTVAPTVDNITLLATTEISATNNLSSTLSVHSSTDQSNAQPVVLMSSRPLTQTDISSTSVAVVADGKPDLDALLGFHLALPSNSKVAVSGGGTVASLQIPLSQAEATDFVTAHFSEHRFNLVNAVTGTKQEQIYVFQQDQRWISVTVLQNKDGYATINFAFTE